MKKHCFIAINLPQEARWEIEALINDLQKINQDPRIKFINPKQVHLTLTFIGEIFHDQIELVVEMLQKIIGDFAATEIITQDLSAFPNVSEPRILYLNVKEVGQNLLPKIKKEIESQLSQAGLEFDQKKWEPHLTLARVKDSVKIKTNDIQPYELSIPVESLDLMESQLKPEGSEYKIIKSFKLKS
ncbi:MAG: RNA 2',3'-cyclic phosphodiesterase [Candidatus Buchananbacteria bacterium]